MDLGEIIAANVRRLRQERNLTQGQLARLAGVSKAMVSDIEKGGSNPTINTLWKLAKGLNVPYTQIMSAVREEATVVSRGDAVMQDNVGGHYRIYCYFKNEPDRNFELFYVELDPHSSHVPIGHVARSQEYIYVIDGTLELRTPQKTYCIGAGDAVVFDPSIRHEYVNPDGGLLRCMVLNYYLQV